MPANDANQLLRQLLQKIEEISDREKDTSARMRMLETSSRLPDYRADATKTPKPTTPTAKASDSPIYTAPKPRPSLPHPPTFGGNKSQWRGWKLEMEGKIEEDALAIGSLRAQLRYIFMHLEGAAKTNVTTFYETQLRQDLLNPCQLLKRLELLYGERNRKQKAIQNLHSIRQREDETFISFYPRFEKEIANANAEGWDDDAKISYLRNALSNKMRDRLVGLSGSDTDTYAGFVQRCVDPATTQVNAVGLRGKANINGFPSKRPEDQELLRKQAKWVNQEEIDARRQDRRCLRCGRNNCRIATCPLAAALRLTYVGVKTAKSTVVTKAAVEEDSEDPQAEQ
ncbi:Retrotransposon gag protein [Pyrenophora tritici-repentis]|nr:Retrotransposon gag protein [Pyrenophora tritici-repentis]